MAGSFRLPNVDMLPEQHRARAREQLGLASAREAKGKAQRSKYGAVKVKVDGILFDSKKESRYYEQLKLRQSAGDILRFHRQVPIDLEGGVVYKLDFLVVYPDGRLEYVDVKGLKTKEFRIKQRQVKARHGIELVLV